ncbi:F/Y-rich N-terminus-domain-containing protein [Pilobolus umbonatus]|nr:F/Y-rich N-terminus-domain-containing protein [Pilobolus umbonatus]
MSKSPLTREEEEEITVMDDSILVTPVTPSGSIYNTHNESEEIYKKLKRKMKEITELNMSLNRDYSHAKKKIRTLTYERNLLLDNINKIHNTDRLSEDSDSDIFSDLSDSDNDIEVTSKLKYKQSKHIIHKSHPSSPIPITNNPNQSSQSKSNSTLLPRANYDIATVASAPPKRSKVARISTKTRRVQPIDRDEKGKPKLPQQIGVLTVLSLGHIVTDRPTFHNERYIFPVGYTVSRTYPSMVDPNANTVVTSTIIDGGDGPRFQIVAADTPDKPIIANSATGAWTVVVRKSNEIRHRDHSNSASGPDYYGFKHPTIAKLIQDLPGARNLKHYVWQTFEEMEPRAAKGVMAAAEKKRGNLEQMGNANRKPLGLGGEEEDEDEEEIEDDDEYDESTADIHMDIMSDKHRLGTPIKMETDELASDNDTI